MAKIFIDGQSYEVETGQNLLHVCLSLGLNLPYFCWHPAMGSVGACRQCAVIQYRDEKDTTGRIVMACMTPATDGTRISINDPRAVAFRASVIEWLMVNHPHDCPVCDEGSECHLQDMTVMTGHVYRRYRGKKRTWRNQYLGPFVNQEMNRCIQCYRCVRFYRGFAGGTDFNSFALRNQVFYGRKEDGALESEFSGNLVEVCPTGVFTDKTQYMHYTRKWDLQTAPSVCVNCSIGCTTIPAERYGTLRRIRNRFNSEVNGYFLCDRGRYGYEFVNSDRRIRQPRLRPTLGEAAAPVKPEEALQKAAALFTSGGKVIGIGSPRASLESNFALRTLVGAENFFSGMATSENHLVASALEILQQDPGWIASLQDVEQSDAVLVLGEDVSNTAPMAAYALRQSVRCQPMKIARQLKIADWDDTAVRELTQDLHGPLYIATPAATRLDDVATGTYHGVPDEIARLGFGVLHAMDRTTEFVHDLEPERRNMIEAIVRDLNAAEHPLIIAGVSLGSEAILQAAANVARGLIAAGKPAKLFFALPECNSAGLGLMGAGSLQQAADAMKTGQVQGIIVLENDLYRRAERQVIDQMMEAAPQVVVMDHLENATTSQADILFPAGTFAESDGTLVNNETRAQRFYQVYPPEEPILESWRWCRDIMIASGRQEIEAWTGLDQVIEAMVAEMPVFAPIKEIAPSADFRVAGQKIPRKHPRYSGRTAITADRNVHEPPPPQDPDSALAFTMEGYTGEPPLRTPPAALIPRFWAPGWNSIQALNKFQQEVGGPLKGGNPTRRLLSAEGTGKTIFRTPPEAFEPRKDEWQLVPLYQIFGSEELSIHTPGIAELAPPPFIGLNPQDLTRLQLNPGDPVRVGVGTLSIELPAASLESLPVGAAGIPVGLPGVPYLSLPSWSRLTPGSTAERTVG